MDANDGASGSQSDVMQSARHLLQLLASTGRQQGSDIANQDMREQRQGGHHGGIAYQQERPSVQMEMTRSFPGIFTKSRGKRRFPAANLVPAKKFKPLEVAFYLLPKQFEKTPKEQEQIIHLQAGLGRRTAHLDESTTHEELCDALKVLFPKLGTVTGGWLLYTSSGGWGSRKLSLVAPDDTGYTGKLLKAASRGGKNLYIAPIQEELSTNSLPLTDDAFRNMPKSTCQKCEAAVPLPLLTEHIKSCDVIHVGSDDNLINVDSGDPEESKSADMQECPVCTKMFPTDFIEAHASSCGESAGNEVMHASTVIMEEQAAMPGPSGTCAAVTDGWLTVSDPTKAISQCVDSFLRIHEVETPLLLSMDIRRSPAEQDMALISFYKRPNVEWGRPLNCRLEGDTAIGQGVTRFFLSTCIEKLKSGFCINFANSNVTRLFEGEPGHLVPSASHFLVESDMFLVAGRMLGHSFLHGGPCLSGFSPAVVHVLLGGSPETATVTLEDCPDLDIRETIALLEGESKLSEDTVSVQDLAHAWDFPSLTENNRKWLFEKLLIHAVIGRVTRQIKQLRRGLKETPMWTVLTQRPDTVAILFPKRGEGNFSPEVLLQRITWPREDEDDEDYSVDTKCRMSGYLRQFIANATLTELTNLVKFWTGWEILPTSLCVEVVMGRCPTASTCFETLRIPGHYKDYASFKSDILACIYSCQTGFGLV
ncbi:uncharacterized protein LOC115417888 [Sphaeramia orbicularis]|uniref:uncharacterized protein LOC115417597 n=1 Tax=Sphaeramia orbicularis TaxID=375764 RepID=UPI00117DD23E|nr:uncharacterized protein LOC115417597 [Sphaeramia orbicularis]XP_029987948.1 uncharacterized protein LOC115417888 [Sphaeramia orbicularis]